MKEKRDSMLVILMVLIVVILALTFLYKAKITGDALFIPPGSAVSGQVKQTSVPEKTISREITQPPKLCPEDQCLWTHNGEMYFHVSNAAIKYLGFPESMKNKVDYFTKDDLEFKIMPDYYSIRRKCLPAGTEIHLTKYKNYDMPIPNAGLKCHSDPLYKGYWWLAALSSLPIDDSPPAVPA